MSEAGDNATVAANVAADEPWLGLVPYGETDAGRFFGRERESAELYRLVQREALTVVFGPSGTGKSSLLNAGLFPRLRDEHFLPISIRIDHSGSAGPRQQIKAGIANAIAEHAIEAAPLNEPVGGAEETVWEYLHRVEFWDRQNYPVTPVLVFDQFEELFTLGRHSPATAQFLEELADLAENYIPAVVRPKMDERGAKLPRYYAERHYKIILTLREDYVSRLDTLTKFMPSVMYNRFSLERMNGEQALDVILKPGGHLVEESVAREIVSFVAAQKAGDEDRDDEVDPAAAFRNQQVEPALLSLVCRELNARRLEQRQAKITHEQVMRSSDDILEDFYERSFDEIDQPGRLFVEDRLVTASGYRSTVPLEDALESGLAEEEIATLIDRRLLRKEDRLGIPHLELTHDVLTGVVQKSRDARREKERQAEERRIRAEQARRTRKILVLVSLSAFVFLAFVVLALISQKNAEIAEEQARTNLNQYLLTSAEVERAGGKFDLPLLLRAAAFHFYSEGLDVRPELVAPDYFRSLSSNLWGTLRSAGPIAGLAWDDCGDRVRFATPGGDGTIGIWEWNPDQPQSQGEQIEMLQSGTVEVRTVAWSRDRKFLASGDSDGKVRIWNTGDWNELPVNQENGHEDVVTTLAWHQDGRRLASGSRDHSIRIWSVELGPEEAEEIIMRTPGPAKDLPEDPAMDAAIDPGTPRCAGPLPGHDGQGHEGQVTAIAWSPAGDLLASASYDGRVLIWEPGSKKEPVSIIAGSEPVNAVAWNSAGTRVAYASDDSTIRIWDATCGQELSKMIGHRDEVWSLDWDHANNRLASGDKTGEIRIWKVDDDEGIGAAILTLSAHTSVKGLRWDKQGERLLSAGGDDDNTIRVWVPDDPGGPADRLREEVATLGDVENMNVLFLSWTGDRLSLAGNETSSGQIWHAESLGEQKRSVPYKDGSDVASWNSSRTRLAIGSGKNVEVWDTTKSDSDPQKFEHADVRALAWDTTGSRLASADKDGVLLVWDVATENVQTLENCGVKGIRTLAWSGKRSRLASGSNDGKVRICDTHTDNGVLLKTFAGHTRRVSSVAWNNAGSWLASASADGTVLIWDAESKSESDLPLRRLVHRDLSGVTEIAWNPAGSLMASDPSANVLAAGTKDKQIRIWDADSGKPLYILRGRERVRYLAWNADGTRLASADGVNDLRVWKFDEESWRLWAERLVNRNLSQGEWDRYIGDGNYRKVFPDLP